MHYFNRREGVDSRALTSTGTPTDGHQRSSTKEKKKSAKRTQSEDKVPPPQVDQGKPDSGSGFGIWEFLTSIGAGDETAEPQSKYWQLEDQIKAQSLKEAELLARLDENKRKLKERETELEELKKTLCMYDDFSEADIQRTVNSINTKVQDLARNTAISWLDTVSSVSGSVEDGGEVNEVEIVDIKGLIGNQLVDALSGGSDSKFADALLQAAWQASILATVAKIISSFSASLTTFDEWQVGHEILKTIADEVMMGESQPAYGRWRFITHKYLRRALSTLEQSAVQAYASEALASCRAVGRLVMHSQCPNDQSLEDAFQAPLRDIVEEAFRLATMIQENIITANYGPFLPRSGDPFDPETMVVEKGDKVSPNDQVVCTTSIGLLCWKKEGRDSTSSLSPQYVFKQAQVFTEASLIDLIASP